VCRVASYESCIISAEGYKSNETVPIRRPCRCRSPCRIDETHPSSWLHWDSSLRPSADSPAALHGESVANAHRAHCEHGQLSLNGTTWCLDWETLAAPGVSASSAWSRSGYVAEAQSAEWPRTLQLQPGDASFERTIVNRGDSVPMPAAIGTIPIGKSVQTRAVQAQVAKPLQHWPVLLLKVGMRAHALRAAVFKRHCSGICSSQTQTAYSNTEVVKQTAWIREPSRPPNAPLSTVAIHPSGFVRRRSFAVLSSATRKALHRLSV